MTPEELAEIIAKVSEALAPKIAEVANAATTSQLKRFGKDVDEKIGKLAVPPPVEKTADPQVTEKIKGTPEMAALQAQIEELRKSYKTAEDGRIAAEMKARNDSTFNTLKQSLSGVKPDLQDAAAKLLMHVEKRITFDENGNPLFRMQREYAPGQVEDVDLPLSSGVEHWMKSKEASPFLPAPGGNTGNGRGGRNPAPGSVPSGRSANGLPVYDSPAKTDSEKVARARENEAALAKLLGTTTF